MSRTVEFRQCEANPKHLFGCPIASAERLCNACRAKVKRPRKPAPFKRTYRVVTDYTGGRRLEKWDEDVGWMIVTNNPEYMRALAGWLTRAAAWMGGPQ